jgi:hypothetical protein
LWTESAGLNPQRSRPDLWEGFSGMNLLFRGVR